MYSWCWPTEVGDTYILWKASILLWDALLRFLPRNLFKQSKLDSIFVHILQSGPMFWEETDTCEYVFNWRTPAACALKVCESIFILTSDSRFSLVYKWIHSIQKFCTRFSNRRLALIMWCRIERLGCFISWL